MVNSATTAITIEQLLTLFAIHGLPELMIVSDNGSVFTSFEFQISVARMVSNNYVKCAPYHPTSNGLAERAVQTFKEALKQGNLQDSLTTQVSRFLFQYRLTPHSTTGISPAELLLGCRP